MRSVTKSWPRTLKWQGRMRKLHIVSPYESFAMNSMIAPLLTDERLAALFEVSVSKDVMLDADINYHVPFHTLSDLNEKGNGKHVALFTHLNPGAERSMLDATANADTIICMSYDGRKQLVNLGIDPSKLWVIHGGFKHYPMRRKNIGVIATEQPNGRKRSHVLIDLVWKLSPRALQALNFILVGSTFESVGKAMANAGASVQWIPSLDDAQMMDVYSVLDLLLVTGYREGGPLPLMEAMSVGLPVLSPRIGYADDFLTHDELYASDDELIAKLESVAKPVTDRAMLASAFSDAKYVDAHAAVFTGLLGMDEEIKDGELRYRQLYRIISDMGAKSIVEIGTWNAEHAVQMIQCAAIKHDISEVSYQGFDLFEQQTARQLEDEFSKPAWPIGLVYRLLHVTGAQIELCPGDTKQTLKANRLRRGADFYFIDGGHSIATITNDWEAVSQAIDEHSVVVFDDYYSFDYTGSVGCNSIVNDLDRAEYDVEFLPEITKVENGPSIQMVKVRKYADIRLQMQEQPHFRIVPPDVAGQDTKGLPSVWSNFTPGSATGKGELERPTTTS